MKHKEEKNSTIFAAAPLVPQQLSPKVCYELDACQIH